MSSKVLGLGTAAMDIVLQCNALPQNDGFSFINNEKVLPGGSCANVLTALSKLNVETSLVAKIGDDFYSNNFMFDLKKNSICSDYVLIDKGGSILHTYITIGKNGERCIFANLGKSLLALTEEEVSIDMLKGISVFYTDMFPGKPALKLAKLCKSNNIKVVFDLECSLGFMNLCGVTKNEIEEMISICDIFCGCSEGMFELSGVDEHRKAAEIIFDKYKPNLGVIATCGEKGAIWIDNLGIINVDAFNVKSIDSTGAGDTFIAGIIYSFLIEKYSKEKALEFACAYAAIKCTQLGGRVEASLTDVLNFINNN